MDQRLNELETKVDGIEERVNTNGTNYKVLWQKCEDCRKMQSERYDAVKTLMGEIKADNKASDKRNVRWHVGNLSAVIGVCIVIILALLKLK